MIDSKLNFRQHISKKVSIANRNLGIIHRIFTYLSQEMFLSPYKAMVRPHLEYASVIWSSLYKKDKITLENTQRRATRLVPSLKGKDIFRQTQTLRVADAGIQAQEGRHVDVYKILNSTDLVSKDSLFKMATYQATRGHPLKLFIRRSRVNVRASSFSMRVIDTWNVVLAPSVDSFKSRLNKYWHGQPLKFEASCYI